jgi:anti-sigma factor (TIGR02949 family)
VSALKVSSDCVLHTRALQAYVDGELSADHTSEIEAHVAKCTECFEQVEQHRALRLSLRRTCEAKAPGSFRDRMAALVAAEAARTPSAPPEQPAPAPREQVPLQALEHPIPTAPRDVRQSFPREGKLIPLRHVMAFAAAAGVVFAVGMSRVEQERTASDAGYPGATTSFLSSVNLDDFIEDLVDMHASPLPPETTNPEELPRFDPFVGVPVRRPAEPTFQPLGVRYDGARMHAIRGKRAALLLYSMQGGHRATMFVFDARAVPPLQRTRLQTRYVSEKPVYVGNVRGYSFAATERAGVGYALATDLDDDISAKLVAAVQ